MSRDNLLCSTKTMLHAYFIPYLKEKKNSFTHLVT